MIHQSTRRALLLSAFLAGCGSGEFKTDFKLRGLGGEGGEGPDETTDEPADENSTSQGGAPSEPTAPTGGAEPQATGGAEPVEFPDPIDCVEVQPDVPIEMTAAGECYTGSFDLLFCSFCEGATVNGEPRDFDNLDSPAPWVLEVESACYLTCKEAADSCAWNGEGWDC